MSDKPWSQMSREERAAHYKDLSRAAAIEMASWEGKLRTEREQSEGSFRSQWQEEKAYDARQSAARRGMFAGKDVDGARWGTGGGGEKVDPATAAKLAAMLRMSGTRKDQPDAGLGGDQTGEGNLLKQLSADLAASEKQNVTTDNLREDSREQDATQSDGPDTTDKGDAQPKRGDSAKGEDKTEMDSLQSAARREAGHITGAGGTEKETESASEGSAAESGSEMGGSMGA